MKTSERLLTCQITLVEFIWRFDQLNGIYCASGEGHRELLSYFSNATSFPGLFPFEFKREKPWERGC